MARDMKFTASLNDQVSKGIDQIIKKIAAASEAIKAAGDRQATEAKKSADRLLAEQDRSNKQRYALQRSSIASDEALRAKVQADTERWWQRQLAIQDQAEKAKKANQEREDRQRIALQRSSLDLAEKQALRAQAQIVIGEKNQTDAATRIQRQAAIAESSLVLDKFDRRIAIERTKHQQILNDLKGNDAAIEAEVRRHNAVVGRVQMDKTNLPNTPFQQLLTGVKQGVGFQNGAAGMALMAGGALGATVAISKLTQGISAAVDMSNRFNTVNRALGFAAGSAREGGKEFQFVREQAERLGIPLLDAAQSYAQMAAAAKGTTLEGKATREVFKGITEASVSLGLSGEQTSGALNALQQMISKGTVQSEELRGQLGERIPGAFQIAARAMGMTTAQLGKALEQGQVFADDFLPKFATELHKTFGETAVTAAGEARAELQKFNNTMGETAGMVGEVFVQAAGLGAKAFNHITDAVSRAAAAQNQYYVAQQQALNGSGPKASNVDQDRVKKLAEAQDDLDRMRRGGEVKAAEQRTKDRAKEDKERKKADQKAATEAKREAAEQVAFDTRAAENALKREAKYQDDVKARANLIADQDYDNRIKREIAARDAQKRIRDAGITSMRPGSSKDLAESGGREQDEIAAFNLSEEAKTLGFERAEQVRTAIHQKYANERKVISQAENQATLAAGITLAQNIGQFMQLAAGKNRTMAKAGMRVTEAAAIASTAAGVAKAFEQSGIYGFLTGAAIAAAGAVQVATIEQQISKFARGTDYAPGGMALVGEQGPEMVYLPKGSQVKTASETARMRNTTLAPVINITMGPGATRSDMEMAGEVMDRRLRALANDLDEIDYRQIRRAGRT